MNLLIDMGNTRLKWAVLENGVLSGSQALLNSTLSHQHLVASWQGLPRPDSLMVSCVGQHALLALVETVADSLWPGLVCKPVRASAMACGVQNGYLHPEKLGVDRWLALLAVHHHYPGPVCIVDCGTAITVDVLAADGSHLGGMISPGLMLMKQALAAGTQALEISDTTAALGLAQHTEAAIYSGTLSAAVGLVNLVLSQQQTPLALVLTGGDAELIAEQLAIDRVVDSDLVLRGLAVLVGGCG
jgi:type III pantothenate kinase